jgi:uncharacterized protein involved in exopolysaccharide biosynthesis
MPDLFDVFFRWWKQIFLLMIITAAASAIVLFFIPKKYIGAATALPAPTYAADKTGVFSQNLQGLYSAFGSTDDLDKFLGTARLDTVYIAVAEELNLAKHYDIKGGTSSLKKAAFFLKKRTRVIKSDYGELQVKVWDTDRNLAANMANKIMEKLQQIHQDVQTANNARMLSKINEEYEEKKLEYQKLSDSFQHANNTAIAELLSTQKTSLLQQIQEYGKLSSQYKLMVDARPEALIIIEKATPALKADKPEKLQIIIVAAVLGLFFGFLAALVLEKRRMMRQ